MVRSRASLKMGLPARAAILNLKRNYPTETSERSPPKLFSSSQLVACSLGLHLAATCLFSRRRQSWPALGDCSASERNLRRTERQSSRRRPSSCADEQQVCASDRVRAPSDWTQFARAQSGADSTAEARHRVGVVTERSRRARRSCWSSGRQHANHDDKRRQLTESARRATFPGRLLGADAGQGERDEICIRRRRQSIKTRGARHSNSSSCLASERARETSTSAGGGDLARARLTNFVRHCDRLVMILAGNLLMCLLCALVSGVGQSAA